MSKLFFLCYYNLYTIIKSFLRQGLAMWSSWPEPHYVIQTGLEFVILLLQTPEC
jgi:hypothetical protein